MPDPHFPDLAHQEMYDALLDSFLLGQTAGDIAETVLDEVLAMQASGAQMQAAAAAQAQQIASLAQKVAALTAQVASLLPNPPAP